jgi:hypothetical protein
MINYALAAIKGALTQQPVGGHLGGGEPIVKPTEKGRFFYFQVFERRWCYWR